MKTGHKKRSSAKNILTIVAIILIFVFLYIGPRIFLATETPFTAIVGPSMSPTLEHGDLIIVKGVRPEEVKIGDIIVFDPSRKEVGRTVHRVVDIKPLANGTLTFETKGDANSDKDPDLVYPENIRGRLLYRIPYIGYIFLDPLILIIIITIIVVVIILWPEEKRRRHRKHTTQMLKDRLP